jgi:hypothetical protein
MSGTINNMGMVESKSASSSDKYCEIHEARKPCRECYLTTLHTDGYILLREGDTIKKGDQLLDQTTNDWGMVIGEDHEAFLDGVLAVSYYVPIRRRVCSDSDSEAT